MHCQGLSTPFPPPPPLPPQPPRPSLQSTYCQNSGVWQNQHDLGSRERPSSPSHRDFYVPFNELGKPPVPHQCLRRRVECRPAPRKTDSPRRRSGEQNVNRSSAVKRPGGERCGAGTGGCGVWGGLGEGGALRTPLKYSLTLQHIRIPYCAAGRYKPLLKPKL
ncbi:hypothetical protein E2C01_010596 [Portunus trituberculatus]|uniref:Uncharacterized protein n=1 Tax=Portunus trituberculatus TaxID=210409 RepID=A0A5B7D933_PORTR|nr:hypothetical protein [Portunus trituberculatus]